MINFRSIELNGEEAIRATGYPVVLGDLDRKAETVRLTLHHLADIRVALSQLAGTLLVTVEVRVDAAVRGAETIRRFRLKLHGTCDAPVVVIRVVAIDAALWARFKA